MKLGLLSILLVLCAGVLGLLVAGAGDQAQGTAPEWSINATAIEACSCPMFCQCYFNAQPAAHSHAAGKEEHFCRANLAYKVNKGNYGAVKLDNAKFWLSNDLGADFSKGQMDWVVITFDKAVTKEQRDGLLTVVNHLFPVKWNSVEVKEGSIDKWEISKDVAHALLDGGKTAEVKLVRMPNHAENPVIRNLNYWGAPRNDGFILMPNEVEAYRVGPKAFEFKGTNGFLITIDMNSKDLKPGKSM